MKYTTAEMMAVAAARALSNDDICFVGIGTPSLACNLTRLTHAPEITLIYESGTIGTKPDVLPLSIGDPELCETARTTVSVPEMFQYWLQGGRVTHASPITFGLKAARWLAMAARQVRLQRAQRGNLTLQFGGAVGNLAALGGKGLDVAGALAEELGLPLPDLPWHAERDRPATTAAVLGVTAGAVAKIANDVVLLTQTEVAEVSEASAPGKGGSSAMPQKRNPVDATLALAAARLATGLVPVILSAVANEQERAVGGWQAEWAAIPDLFRHTAAAVSRVRTLLSGLHVDASRMRRNLDLGGGLIMAESLTMALAPHVGRPDAQRLVQGACGRALSAGSTLREAALEEPEINSVLSSEEVDRALDPENYRGGSDALIDRALETYREARAAAGRA